MRTLLQLLLTLFLLAALLWLIWQGYLLIDSKGKELDPGARSILVGTAFIALAATLILSSAVRRGAREVAMADQMRRRADLYENFLTIWQTLKNEVDANQQAQLQLQADEFKTSIALYGSGEVLKSINRLLEKAAAEGPHQTQEAFEALLLAMRADLGQSNIYPLRNELKLLFSPPKS